MSKRIEEVCRECGADLVPDGKGGMKCQQCELQLDPKKGSKIKQSDYEAMMTGMPS